MEQEKKRLSPLGKAFVAAVMIFFAAFLLYPIGHVFFKAFFIEGRFTLSLFGIILQEGSIERSAILNSALLGLATVVGTSILAFPLSYVMARFRLTGKRLLGGLLLVPLIMPPFVGAIGMRRFLARGGSINLLLEKVGIIDKPIDFLGAGGFWAVVLLQVLHLYPIMYLNLLATLANVDPSLEDAARNLGDRGLRLFRKITLPLMLPGFFAGSIIVFIWAFTDLGTPLIFGFRRVVAVQIFDGVKDIHENPLAYALVVVVVTLTILFFLVARKLFSKGYAMLGHGATASVERPVSVRWKFFIYLGMAAVVVLALLPHLSVMLTSITRSWSGTILPSEATGKFYSEAVRHPLAVTSVRNSLLLSLASTSLDLVLGFGIAYILVRRSFRGAAVLDALAMLPLALPGIVLAFGYVACYSGTVLDPRRNPMPLLIIAYAVRRLPFMVRSAQAGLEQCSPELEDASLNLGAPPRTTIFRITVPLISANLIAGVILCFSFAMLEVSDSLILAFRERHYPITKAIYQLQGRVADGEFIASAMGMLAMLLLAGTMVVAATLLGKRMGALFRA